MRHATSILILSAATLGGWFADLARAEKVVLVAGSSDTTDQESINKGGRTNLEVNDYTYSAFVQTNYQLTDLLSLQGGVRLDHLQMSNITTVDPRLALRYQLQEDVAVKAAWGIYHQSLRLASQLDFSFFDTWLPTDTIRRSGFGHVIADRHHVLTLERGLSFIALVPGGYPTYAGGLFAPIPRYLLGIRGRL